jgi:hypothetical protein
MLTTRVAFKQVTQTENSERLLSRIFPKHNLEILRRRKHSLTSCSIDHLTDSMSNHTGFSYAGLCLGNGILAASYWHHCSLLNSRQLLKPICINTSQQILLNVHLIKAGDHFHTRTYLKNKILPCVELLLSHPIISWSLGCRSHFASNPSAATLTKYT